MGGGATKRYAAARGELFDYLVVRWETVFGRLDSLLYVGPQVVEWKYDHDDIADGYALTFTKNWANDDFSEFGYIAFRKHPGAGITRIG